MKLKALIIGLVLVALTAVACAEEDEPPPPAPAAAPAAPAATPTPAEPQKLVVMTHDSFDIGEEVIREFEEANNATVLIQKAGDAGEALVRAILEKGNPSADLLYGVDNTYLGRGLDEDIFLALSIAGPEQRSRAVHPGQHIPRDARRLRLRQTSTTTRHTWRRTTSSRRPRWRS